MYYEGRNIYKRYRISAGLTLEQVSERAYKSPRTYAKYENGEIMPDNETVSEMCKACKTLLPGYYHLQNNALGRLILPEIEEKPMANAVALYNVAMQETLSMSLTLSSVAMDNKVNPDEIDDWIRIVKAARRLIKALFELILNNGDTEQFELYLKILEQSEEKLAK